MRSSGPSKSISGLLKPERGEVSRGDLCVAHDAEGAAEALGDEIVLRLVVVVECALGEIEAGRDAVDRGAAIAMRVDLQRGGLEEAFLRLVPARRVCAGGGKLRQRRGERGGGEAVQHDVGHAGGEPWIFLDVEVAEPGERPEHLFEQDQCADGAVGVVEGGKFGGVHQRADAVEHLLVAFDHAVAVFALERADGGEGGELGRLALSHGSIALDKEGDEAGDAVGGVRLAFGLSHEIVEHGIAGLEAGDGELLLAGEIVGDAGGAQADQLGDGGEAHALEALSVEHGNGGRDDVGATALEAVGADGAGVSFRGVARFDLGLPGQHGRECAPTGQAVGSGRRGNYSS